MRLLITGDRNWTDREFIHRTLSLLLADHSPASVTIIHGDCRGADKLAAEVAVNLGFNVEAYPADWDVAGPAAGPRRNQRMLDEGKPDRVIAFHGDLSKSKGTKDMLRRAADAGLLITVYDGLGDDTIQRTQ